MKPESLRAVVRPRPSWEAIDLGFLLARRHYRTMLRASFLFTLPIVALAMALPPAWELWASLALWWIKPAYERLHLHILSRALFGEEVGVREALRQYPRYARPDALGWLTLRRLSPTRSFDLPASQLEGLRPRERRPRQAILHRGSASQAAVWLTVLGVHVELFLLTGALALVALLTPETLDFSPIGWLVGFGEGSSPWAPRLLALLQHLCALFVAPFYVACGFCLYLNRRTELEGWDIEVGFRQIAADLPHTVGTGGRRAGGRSAGAALALALLLLPTASPSGAIGAPLDAPGARASIEEVLEDPAFHDRRTWSIPRLILDWTIDSDSEEPPASPAWLGELLRILTNATEALLIALALGVAAAVIWRIARERHRLPAWRRAGERDPGERPAELHGLAVTRESLPENVLAAAHAEWRAGRARAALALLYRASLASLIETHAIELRPSFTEGQCIDAATPHLPPESAEVFERVSRSWQGCAYGRRTPSDLDFEALCRDWQRHLTPAAAAGDERGR